MPAGQGFDALDTAGDERKDRLIGNGQLLVFDSHAQLGLELQGFLCGFVHVLVENLVPAFSGVFRVVHRRVGVTHHVLRGQVFFRCVKDTDAGRAVNDVAAGREGDREFPLDAFGYPRYLGNVIFAFNQHRELVAAEPCDNVGRPNAFAQAGGDADKKLIADQMTKAVVDVFESVEIDKQDTDTVPGVVRILLQGFCKLEHEPCTVHKAGAGIVGPLVTQPLLGQLLAGNILKLKDKV